MKQDLGALWVGVIFALPVSSAPIQAEPGAGDEAIPRLDEAISSKLDVWADAALQRPGGPSYEFFAKLLPPLRYVNADFREYPIVLSAPKSLHKARLISNGSSLNTPGGARSWNDVGTAVTFRAGPDELRFGEFPGRLNGPRYVEGYRPVVQIQYRHGESVYLEETFAAVDPALAGHAVVFVRFSLAEGTSGNIAAQIDSKFSLQVSGNAVRDETGRALVWFDADWRWQRQRLVATLAAHKSATLALATQPVENSRPSPLANEGFERHRRQCLETWDSLLRRGMEVEVAEPLVNNAWRSLVTGTFALIRGERMHYSAGNQYDRLYEAEGSDAVEALCRWGFAELAPPLIVSQLDFTRKGLEFHQAGHKLQLLANYYWLTRDREFLNVQRPRWEKEIQLILNSRTNEHGLFPREQYCGDVADRVYSLNSNAKCWRALRDMAAVLADAGEGGAAERFRQIAGEFRNRILSAVEKSERHDVEPPFIPIALFGEETPPIPITGTKIGSYWNLMANYVEGSEIFGQSSARENALLEYVQRQGGLCMGLIRSRPNPTFWTGLNSINPLYGLRYVLTLLRRDEADRALVSFYGMLAQGLTRDTFIGGEGASLTPLDGLGRLFYCPPNSAANAFFLSMLRHLLVQDWDLDQDGEPETLRLLFATPRRWLADGQTLRVERAPTAWGEISMFVQSRLKDGEVLADIVSPKRQAPRRMLLRVRLPEEWQIVSARADDRELNVDPRGTVDVSPLKGKFAIRFSVRARAIR